MSSATPSTLHSSLNSPPASSTIASSPPVIEDTPSDSEELPSTSKNKASSSKKIDPDEEEDTEARLQRLSFLLEKSSLYANLLKDQMDRSREKHAAAAEAISEDASKSKKTPTKGRGRGRLSGRFASSKSKGGKRGRIESDDEDAVDEVGDVPSAKRVKVETKSKDAVADEDEESSKPTFTQPALLTGGTLKDYQLEGVAWMVSLWENGISGILADEMGLGKTIQTIAFIAYLRTRVESPFLVVCPLSVLHNWADEFEKFAPDIPTCMYHGPPDERKEMRRTVMSLDIPGATAENLTAPPAKPKRKRGRPPKAQARRTSYRKSKPVDNSDDELAGFTEDATDAEPEEADEPEDSMHQKSTFPVVITTYEIIIKDRQYLAKYNWGYIVVDEGHRLKNMDCKLMQEIKKYTSAGRMVLTGTPLHNNLAELWSLLNFILPDIFDDVQSFQEWFNLPELSSVLSTDRSSHILHTLHAILKPFLLRRVKTDVERTLPPKKEYVLYAPLSERQHEIYDALVRHDVRSLLVGARPDAEKEDEGPVEVTAKPNAKAHHADLDSPRKLRKRMSRKYDMDGDDDKYLKNLEKGLTRPRPREPEKSPETLGREYAYRAMVKKINNLHLDNLVMQLRKVCSHPFLFDWPIDPHTGSYVVNEELVNASGKMMVLERLLDELFKRGHKVLVFSQFTTMLDVIEDWATEFKGWPLCRIDGSSKPMDRRDEMNRFQKGGDAPDAPRLFLLSTRAGGLGINLTAADTVVFYDSDWNPQMDLQAADRAHRIGQTKPVLIFRLVSKHTIENTIIQRATAKRQLEAMIIAKGKFKMPANMATKPAKQETIAEMAASLLALEGEKIEVVQGNAAGKASIISDAELDSLLDRRPEVFQGRGKGWTSAGIATNKDTSGGKKAKRGAEDGAAFAVYEAPQVEGNDALAKMLGEDIPE
ncbi:hypothetical protein EVG20_g9948 [Dentipellis fragilis]|uniref:Helicase ATP-binding domain-containing protein n=1 Tax=Dentipellis fragilis TaxID=205917 RepID=A0A4Y9XXG6_9AGAM|nr:hypothetical protein EVG20_g9948 [Dentipellis fragilis]